MPIRSRLSCVGCTCVADVVKHHTSLGLLRPSVPVRLLSVGSLNLPNNCSHRQTLIRFVKTSTFIECPPGDPAGRRRCGRRCERLRQAERSTPEGRWLVHPSASNDRTIERSKPLALILCLCVCDCCMLVFVAPQAEQCFIVCRNKPSVCLVQKQKWTTKYRT